VIATLDGVEVKDSTQLTKTLIAKSAGTSVRLRLIRAGKERTVAVTLGQHPWAHAVARAAAAAKLPQVMLDTGGHTAIIRGLAFTPDGKPIVSGSEDQTIRVWDIDSRKTVRFIRGDTGPGNWATVYTLALSPDGRWLAVGGYFDEFSKSIGGAVRLYDFASGRLETPLQGHDNVVLALAFSSDSKRLVSGSSDKTAIVWDLARRQQLHRLSGHGGQVKAVAFSNDGKRVVTGASDGILRLWSAVDGRRTAEMTEHKRRADREDKPLPAGVTTVAASPTEPLIASGDTRGAVLLWDGRTGAFLREFANPGGLIGYADIDSLTFSPDGRWLLYTDPMRGCMVAEVATGREFHGGELREPIQLSELIRGPDKPGYLVRVNCRGRVAFSPDGRRAAGADNNAIHVFDPRTRRDVRTLEGAGAGVHTVAFADDGGSILWGNYPRFYIDPTAKFRVSLTHGSVSPWTGGRLGLPSPFNRSSPRRTLQTATGRSTGPSRLASNPVLARVLSTRPFSRFPRTASCMRRSLSGPTIPTASPPFPSLLTAKPSLSVARPG
jgi:WD40 repeat protein